MERRLTLSALIPQQNAAKRDGQRFSLRYRDRDKYIPRAVPRAASTTPGSTMAQT